MNAAKEIHSTEKKVFYHEGITVDEKWNIDFTKAAEKALEQFILEVYNSLPEITESTPSETVELTGQTAEEVINTLTLKRKSLKTIKKYAEIMLEILGGKLPETKKEKKVLRKMKKEAHTPSTYITLHYQDKGKQIEYFVPIIVRKGFIPSMKDVQFSLAGRSSFEKIFAKRRWHTL